MKKLLDNWPRFAFVYLPLLIITVDAAVLVREYFQPRDVKAIRLVKESKSRKENFTVQQYLYTTVYHRKNNGKAIKIDGWTAQPSPQGSGLVMVEFRYTDGESRHVARWEVEVESKSITPRNEAASHLSWH